MGCAQGWIERRAPTLRDIFNTFEPAKQPCWWRRRCCCRLWNNVAASAHRSPHLYTQGLTPNCPSIRPRIAMSRRHWQIGMHFNACMHASATPRAGRDSAGSCIPTPTRYREAYGRDRCLVPTRCVLCASIICSAVVERCVCMVNNCIHPIPSHQPETRTASTTRRGRQRQHQPS